MTRIFADRALLDAGWAENVAVDIDAAGRIAAVEADAAPSPTPAARVRVLLPALSNLHSHAFQRAMAGMTERRSAGRDSFWTWRELMYRFVGRLTPGQVEAVAALTYLEMLEAGYAAVGEFHYLHHQPDGAPYAALSELSQRIFAAASATGIGLTHLPVLYSHGGAGGAAVLDSQRRFANDLDRFVRLVDEARQAASAALPTDGRVGVAPHSLRATVPDQIAAVGQRFADGPVHIHIAEQPREVEEIEAWLGARPVDWLLDNAPVGPGWCLVHATHMTEAETGRLAASGAVAGLCPITEANLGDGPFNGLTYLEAGGAFGVGSDSNVRISVAEELRTLEYSQRLRDLARNVLLTGDGSVGESLYRAAARGGAQALGRAAGAIAVGRLADLVAIDDRGPALCGLATGQLLDGWLFAADDRVVTDVWAAGRHVVRDGRHPARERIVKRYRAALAELVAAP